MVGGAKDDMVLRLEGWLRMRKLDLLVKRIFGCEDLLLVRVRKVVEWFLGSFVFSADVFRSFVRSGVVRLPTRCIDVFASETFNDSCFSDLQSDKKPDICVQGGSSSPSSSIVLLRRRPPWRMVYIPPFPLVLITEFGVGGKFE